jgi:hypothetical protein
MSTSTNKDVWNTHREKQEIDGRETKHVSEFISSGNMISELKKAC